MGIFKYELENCPYKLETIRVDLKLVLAHNELKGNNPSDLEQDQSLTVVLEQEEAPPVHAL